MPQPISIFWFRRDLRLQDNAGLYHALRGDYPVVPLFIFDREILDKLEDRKDARVAFIHQRIQSLKAQLQEVGSEIVVRYGKPAEIWSNILQEYDIRAVYTNRDYEPYAHERDGAVKALLEAAKIEFHTYKDQVIFEGTEVLKDDGDPYVVFSPYKRTWLGVLKSRPDETYGSYYLKPYPTEDYFDQFASINEELPLPALADMNFEPTDIALPGREVDDQLIAHYDATRDNPVIEGTTRLGIHFRHGSISIRQQARRAWKLNEIYLSELVWREFYSQILQHFPHVVTESFRREYDAIEWRNEEEEFKKWCEGKTGYPLVDAGMRQLNSTGWMHNRVRMLTASFLTKHLLIDWRWGEAYFAAKLIDFELASNNGGWQWAAGSGTDAAPYFRIFNPTTQFKKFDPQAEYVKRYVPEYGTQAYPEPMVDHKMARQRALDTYKAGLAAGRAAKA